MCTIWNFRDELSVSDNIIFKAEKVVIPRKMQSQMLHYIYSSHLSIEKYKQQARDVLFWPGMTSQIEDVREDVVLNCQVCSTYQQSNTKEFMLPHKIPEHPWSQAGADLFLLNGKSWSIITLALSSSICSTQQLVNELLGTNTALLVPITPNPMMAEKAVQTVKNCLKEAVLDKRDPYLALLEYRNTPISDSFTQQLMGR